MRSVAVIDYGMGNLRSVLKAWEAAGAKSRLVSSPSDIDEKDVLVYEIDFDRDAHEYSYEINAKTGVIVDRDKDIED